MSELVQKSKSEFKQVLASIILASTEVRITDVGLLINSTMPQHLIKRRCEQMASIDIDSPIYDPDMTERYLLHLTGREQTKLVGWLLY